LGKRTPVIDAGVERETMPLRHDMRQRHGGILAAPLCIAARSRTGSMTPSYPRRW